jgi:putative sigma-54 modulation protein
MELNLTSKGIELTPELRRHVERKLNRLARHLGKVIETRVELTEEKTKSPEHRFLARVSVDSGKTFLHSEERGESLLSAVDKVAQSMERQIEHRRGKLRDKGKGSSFVKSEVKQEAEPDIRKVVKVKRFALKPMSVAEAADQMELLGHDFFLFHNIDTDKINLLYRRKDGNYGLIEPEWG